MQQWIVGAIVAIIGIGLVLWLFFWPSWRARRILQKPFPRQWRRILRQRVRLYQILPPPLQRRLEHFIQLFIHDKKFYGAAGLVITDTIRVTIAAEACVLILGRTIDEYAKLRSIVVYPSSFLADEQNHVIRLGESWHNGRVIIAWDEVANHSLYLPPGHNVTIHEFAHQLDSQDGYADGIPNIPASAIHVWSQAFSHALAGLRQQLQAAQPTWLNPYAATNAAEFFAVCSEAFFTDPYAFEKHYPDLFQLLRSFYRLDPRAWHTSRAPQDAERKQIR